MSSLMDQRLVAVPNWDRRAINAYLATAPHFAR